MPSRTLTSNPEQIGLEYEDIIVKTSDHESIHGWFISKQDARGVILFFHGNAGNVSHRLDSIHIFNQLGFSVFIIDYRGYGESTGSPSERGTYLDAEAALKYLTDSRKIPLDQIVYFGRSLGSSIASQLATKYQPKGLIIESGFTSAPDVATDLIPFFPIRWLVWYSYSNIDNLKTIHCPILIIHSPDDEIIPFKHGEQLYAVANEPKQFLKIRGGHNEGFYQSGELYTNGLKRFFNQLSK